MENGSFFFKDTVKILPLGGCDLVLGVQWLRKLGPISFDYELLSLKFQYGGEEVQLQGKGTPTTPTLNMITVEGLWKELQEQEHGLMVVIHPLPCEQTLKEDLNLTSFAIEGKESQEEPTMQALLEAYSDIFQEPNSMPPMRSLDHSIPLKANSTPFSLRPYKCSNDQKNEVEKLVLEMLQFGVIRPSQSPYAPPILLAVF